jgi:hypothetical protein
MQEHLTTFPIIGVAVSFKMRLSGPNRALEDTFSEQLQICVFANKNTKGMIPGGGLTCLDLISAD